MGADIAASIVVGLALVGAFSLTLISLPGNLAILLVGLGYAWLEGFNHITFQTLYILFGLFLTGELIEFIAGAIGAKKQKASGWVAVSAIVGAVFGGVIGTSVLPVIGSILGAVTGAFTASYAIEYLKTNDAERARQVGISVMKGQAIGMIFKIVIAIAMAVLIAIRLPW